MKNRCEQKAVRSDFGRGDRIRTCEISWSQTKRDTKLRHTPMAFSCGCRCGQTCGQRRFLNGFMIFGDGRKRRRVNGSRRFRFCAGRENIRAPKASALPTALHPGFVWDRIYHIFTAKSRRAAKNGQRRTRGKNGQVRADLPPDPRPALRTGTAFPLLPAEQPRDALYDPTEEAQHFCQKRGGCPVGLRGVRVFLFAGVQP